MIINKENVRRGTTSCNFCRKGALSSSKTNLVYPYEYVLTFKRESNGVCVSICEDCLTELYDKGTDLFNPDPNTQPKPSDASDDN